MIFANHDLNYDIFGILIPAQSEAAETNSVDSITMQTNICKERYGRNPNVFMVSIVFFNNGEIFFLSP